MSPRTLRSFRHLEGHHVSVALTDGSRLDDCELVSAGRGATASIWLHDGIDDRILSASDVVELWELT
jgi:hypothetical protein